MPVRDRADLTYMESVEAELRVGDWALTRIDDLGKSVNQVVDR
jgi:hypothetical protein